MSRLTKLLGIVAALLLAIPAQANETLTYDANGNVQSRSLPGGTSQYGYDDLDRLTSEAGPAKTQNLTYDANDNRLSDGTGNKTYTANTNKLATANGQAITLDKVGNITLLRGFSLDWNQAGQLKTVKQGSTLLATYYYDYRGRRSRKVTPTETTIYIYDLADHLLGEFNGTGSPLRTYIWKDDTPVAVILHGTPEKVLYLETDHLNTPIAARDENAKLVWKWESDAFGSTLPNEDPDGDGQKTTINLRFPGQYFDKESGFHYNHHRYYDPLTGRYLSSDPIGLAGGRNGYSYVGGNPMSRIDPSGKFFILPIIAAIAESGAGTWGLAGLGVLGSGWWIFNQNQGKDGPSVPVDLPGKIPDFDFDKPGQCPVDSKGKKWPWKGQAPQGGDKGGYKNPDGPESLHPDLGHGDDIGPHWDFNDRNGPGYRIGPDGTISPK